ncbi:MAG: hypothetical protein HY541_06220 [Deltaproteobacteria bacterium]|nr:hypothetical protein [Deltaproteobacteria bacterium]
MIDSKGLEKKLRLYQTLTVLFALATTGLSLPHVLEYFQKESPYRPEMIVQESAPHSGFVKKIIEPLRYSGLPGLLRPDVSLEIDFQNKTWKLKNIHDFDANGNLLLTDGRYGICGDLAAYVYQKIRPVFGERYLIEFMRVFDSNFFKSGDGFHIILRIVDMESGMQGTRYKKTFLLDPSFRRYGEPNLFPDYRPKEEQFDHLPFLVEKNPDDTFKVGLGVPILINRNAVIMLWVAEREGVFDQDNFRVVLSLQKIHEYRSVHLLIMEKREGNDFTWEAENVYKGFLKKSTYEQLKKRIGVLFSTVSPAPQL